ncbi:dephospho-CoA kinase [Rothia mucilaginosa]|uniref:dephospho-CoA kinase n=1 Tax=Rothia mucilaginosa TaxID=43675 RepID=UPI001D4BA154|nr:dephospho-CoA kinase [Rothia mucilaginosa]MBS6433949.1 dephospho-CoA kinase [Rothia mucilaginosa]
MSKQSSSASSAKPVRRYALTGGIGSGKSTIAALFVEQGAFLVDADAISRSLMEPGEAVLARTVAVFGEHLLDEEGRLNRPALARIVFNDEQARLRLNAMVHPAIRERAAQLVEQAQSDPGFSGIILEDIPLLVESGDPSAFEGVVVVRTPLATRLHRLVSSRGMSEEDARARIAAQATDEQREAVATWIIDNGGSLEETAQQVRAVWQQMTTA